MSRLLAVLDLAKKNDWPPMIVVSRQDWAEMAASELQRVDKDDKGPYIWIGGYLTQVRPMPPMTEAITLANHVPLGGG